MLEKGALVFYKHLFLSPRNSVGGDVVMRPFVCGWVRSCVCSSRFALVGTIQTLVFARSLSNFNVSCSWWQEEPYWFWVTGSKVKVKFGTLSIKPCGHDTGHSFLPYHFKTLHVSCSWREKEPYWVWVRGSKVKVNLGALPCWHDRDFSFCPITFKLHMKVVADERRNPIDFGSWGQRSNLTLCLLNIVGTIQATVFSQSLSNFTCELFMMRGGPLLILGQRSRSTRALSVYRLVGIIQTTVLVQSLSNFMFKLWVMRGGTLLILGRGVNGQGHRWHLSLKPCGYDKDYSFCPITFKLHM